VTVGLPGGVVGGCVGSLSKIATETPPMPSNVLAAVCSSSFVR
jgi:hypothetical protein